MFLNNKSSQNEFHNLNQEQRVNTREIQAEQLIANAGLYDSEKITTPNQATTHETNRSSRFLLALIFYPYQHLRFSLCTAFKSGSFKKVLSQLSLALLLFGLMNSSAHAELMQLYYSSARGDNFTAVSSSGKHAAKNAGYTRARDQGYLLYQSRRGSLPVQLWYHSGRGDHFSAVSTQGKTDARNAGYRFVRTQGYVYANWRPNTTAMKLWWSGARGDNFSTLTADGESAARAAGYRYVRTQGYVYINLSTPIQFEVDEFNNTSEVKISWAPSINATRYELIHNGKTIDISGSSTLSTTLTLKDGEHSLRIRGCHSICGVTVQTPKQHILQ